MTPYSIYGPEKWEQYFTDQVSAYLLDKGHEVFMHDKMKFHLDITDECDNWYGVIRKNIIFQNNNTNQFFMINHADQEDNMSDELISHPLCVGMLKCQYQKGNYKEYESKVSAFTYGIKERDKYFAVREQMKVVKPNHRRMYFKGNEMGRRDILSQLMRMDLINSDYGYRDGMGARNRSRKKISQEQYLQNMAESAISLSLPGNGNLCHRELESFGIGVPVIMPTLKNQYYHDLIPDVHYIAVDNSSIGSHRIKYYTPDEENTLCGMIKNKYKEVIDDEYRLNSVSRHAMKWFNENICFPSSMKLMETILLKEFGFSL